jgi:hypothetical protein
VPNNGGAAQRTSLDRTHNPPHSHYCTSQSTPFTPLHLTIVTHHHIPPPCASPSGTTRGRSSMRLHPVLRSVTMPLGGSFRSHKLSWTGVCSWVLLVSVCQCQSPGGYAQRWCVGCTFTAIVGQTNSIVGQTNAIVGQPNGVSITMFVYGGLREHSPEKIVQSNGLPNSVSFSAIFDLFLDYFHVTNQHPKVLPQTLKSVPRSVGWCSQMVLPHHRAVFFSFLRDALSTRHRVYDTV